MDKSENGKTITIKINGKDRPLNEDQKNVQKVQPKNPEKIERNLKSKGKMEQQESFNNDHLSQTKSQKEITEELEEILSSQTAATQEAEEESFDWILPDHIDDEEIREYKIATPPPKKKAKGLRGITSKIKRNNRNGMVSSIFFAVFFAVLLGTTFGVILLKLVITDPSIETTGQAPVEEPKDQTVGTTGESNGGATGGTAELALSPINGYVVQGGVFSTVESAKGMVDQVSQKGVSTKLVTMGDKTLLFVGLADNLENAKQIGNKLKESGVEVFAKEVSFGGNTKTDLAELEKKTLELAPSLYSVIAAASTNISLANSLPPNVLEEIKTQQVEWNKIDGKSIGNKEVQQIKVELDSAVSNIISYSENPSENLNSKVQQNLLNFLAFYHSL